MTGGQLVKILENEPGKLHFDVLIGIDGKWVKLESVTYDLLLKTVDLSDILPINKENEEDVHDD